MQETTTSPKIVFKFGLTFPEDKCELIAKLNPNLVYHEPLEIHYLLKDIPPKGSIFKKIKWFFCTSHFPDTDVHYKAFNIMNVSTVVIFLILLLLTIIQR